MVAQVSKYGKCWKSDLISLLPVELFKALGDPTRVSLLCSLALTGEPQSVSQIAACCPIDLSVVSRHLKQLKAAGVVASEKRGKEVFYRLRTSYLAGLLRNLADALESCCPEPEAAPVEAD